jgi:ABC-type polar amino acid transport system ATPase subunit
MKNEISQNCNFFLLDEITSDIVHTVDPEVCENVIMQLENLKTTSEGIILTGSVGYIWVRSPVIMFFMNKLLILI